MSWQDEYRRKLVRPEEAVQFIQSNMRVYIHPGCAEPETLVEALMARGPFVKNVEIVHLMTTGRATTSLRRWKDISGTTRCSSVPTCARSSMMGVRTTRPCF